MLEDRSYMKAPDFRPRTAWSAVIVLLLINLAVFILVEISIAYGGQPDPFKGGINKGTEVVFKYFGLSNRGLMHGFVWQLLTFQFLHSGMWHFLLNMFGLYIFGRVVEDAIGSRHFYWLYLGSGVVGGLLQMALGFILPSRFGVSVVGASAGVFGLIAAFAIMNPMREILLFFVLPIKARHFLWMAAGVSLFYIIVPADSHIAHGAHLGGLIGGVLYIRKVIDTGLSFRQWQPFWKRPVRKSQTVNFPKAAVWKRDLNLPPSEPFNTDFISREVDPILDKISAHGIQSLTPRERQILTAAREKMDRR